MRYTSLFFFFIYCVFIHPSHGQTSWADATIRRMSLDEKIGQLFMIAVYSNKNTEYEKEIEMTLKKYHVGGIIFFQGTPIQQAKMTQRYQAISSIPLLIGMDAEHGIGWRLKGAMEFPRQTLLGAIQDTAIIYRIGKAIGEDCRLLGVHVNFAPVADINNNRKNPVIGIRSFGEDREEVAQRSIAYMQGLLAQNIMPVAKHFPGHGDTDVDSHLALPIIRHNASRLDSIELYPFNHLIAAGIPAIMTAHVSLPAYDSTQRPASLSRPIVTELLKNNLHFQGLCFTDAMNMKGVTKNRPKGEAEVIALQAGNDVLLFPEDIEIAVKKIKEAIKKGRITPKMIDEKCRKILIAKEKYVLPQINSIDTTTLLQRINTLKDTALWELAYKKAITLIRNNDSLLPLVHLDTLKIASVYFGDQHHEAFQKDIDHYTRCDHFSLKKQHTPIEREKLRKQLTPYNCIIIYNHAARNQAKNQFGYSQELAQLIQSLKGKRVILCHPATPYGLNRYAHLPVDAILVSYSHDIPAQRFAAQAIFGGVEVNGKLPVTINSHYPQGYGLTTSKIRLGYQHPESRGMNSATLQKIDSLCLDAIKKRATPGCQVLIAKDGYIIYNKAFGYNTYKKQHPNQENNIYDIASVTKITATLPALMMLYDRHKIKLDTPIAHYYPLLQQTNKSDITPRELLLHMGGLKPAFSFFAHAINYECLKGRLFSSKYTSTHRKKLQDRLYINTHFQYRDSTFSFSKKEDYQMVSPHFYIHSHFRDSIHEILLNTDLLPKKKYTYSDIGFVLLKDIIEEQSGVTLDRFYRENISRPLGAYDTDFLAHHNLDMKRVVPSSSDQLFRKSLLKGYVHDPIAALLGGVSGNAGLFSCANDLAKIMSMYLNHGVYGGERFIDSTTIELFTRPQMDVKKNRRGLGFDKPECDTTKTSPACKSAPASSYGHTGFTGTMVWNDPQNKIIYIFLSNRTYPDEFNNKLFKNNYRTEIQEVIYRAIATFQP